VVGLSGLATSATSGLFGYMDASLQADYLLLPESLVLGGGNVGAGPELARSIRALPGVAEVTTLRRADAQANGTAIQLIGVDPETFPRLSGLVFTAGDAATAYAQLGQGRTIILNGMFAASNRVGVGQEMTLQTAEGMRSYRVAGVGVDYLNAKVAAGYISQANLAQDFREKSDVLIMLNLAPGADQARVETSLLDVTRDYPAFGVLSYERLRQSQTSGTDALNYSLYVMISLLAIPSLLALANTLGINVLERTRELGMLRAVGATRGQVQRLVLAESLILTAMGAAFGILGGIWFGYILVVAEGAIGLPVPYFFPYGGILTAVAVALLFGVLAAWLPARRAARLDVVTALAYE
jgi:putative ABC transport system permease protein